MKSSGPAKITVKEAGPLVASLLIESEAPSCRRLVREVRVVDGLDRVELIDEVDKLRVRTPEGLHFGFEFNVPGAIVRINSPLAVVEPEADQLPGACKNWFSVERWVDVANADYGVTWATADAPLVEMGGLTANLLRSQPDPKAYLKTIRPSPKLYSWVMNNHWHTNYQADQEGPTVFRYAIRPHRAYDPIAAARFGLEATEPLIVLPAAGEAPRQPPLRIEACGRRPLGPQTQRRWQGLDHSPVRGLRPGSNGASGLEPAALGIVHGRGRRRGAKGAGTNPCARLELGVAAGRTAVRPGWLALWLCGLALIPAGAHPISLCSATVEVSRDKVTARLEVMCEDFVMLYGYTADEDNYISRANLLEGMKRHIDLLLRDFMIRDRDGQLLSGRLENIESPAIPERGILVDDLMQTKVVYQFAYPVAKPPEYLTFQQRIGSGSGMFVPSVLQLTVRQTGTEPLPAVTLTGEGEVQTFEFDWSETGAAKPQAGTTNEVVGGPGPAQHGDRELWRDLRLPVCRAGGGPRGNPDALAHVGDLDRGAAQRSQLPRSSRTAGCLAGGEGVLWQP